MYLGDNFVVGGISGLVDGFRAERPDAQILLTQVADPSAFGVAELDDRGRIVGLEEKPIQPKSDLALVGIYLFTPAIHEAVRSVEPSWRGELEITDAIQWLIDQDRTVRSTTISGYWKDTGNTADMLEVNRSVLDTLEPYVHGRVDEESEVIGRVVIEDGAEVSGSRIVGPVVIGEGTVVRDAYIGPYTSVSANCRIEQSEIEYSIVLRGSSVRGVRRVEASLIGRDVEVTPAPAYRPPTGSCSVITVRSRSRRELPNSRDRRCRFHRLPLRPYAARLRRPRRRLAHRPRQAHLRRQPRQPRRGGGPPDFAFVQGDICDAELVAKLMAEHDEWCTSQPSRMWTGPSAAAPSSSDERGRHAHPDRGRAPGGRADLRACLDRRGLRLDRPRLLAGDPTAGPQLPYSAAKASSDLLSLSYHRTHGLDVRVTRCSNNYGHHHYPEKLIPLFVTNLLDGKKVPLYGDGGNVRDWLHIDDHVQGIDLVRTKGRAGEIYNIGGGTELTNKELTGLLLDACGADWDSSVEYVADRLGHDRRYSVDCGKIRRELGYAPRKDFREGLAETVRWYRDNRAWWEPLVK